MSIAALDNCLGSCPAPSPGTELLYFNYDYSTFRMFKIWFPKSEFVALAFVDGWQWHLSVRGRANIRPSPFTDEEVVFQGPPIVPFWPAFSPEPLKCGVVGFLFRIAAEDEDRLLHARDISYVRHCQYVKAHRVIKGATTDETGGTRAYMHFDPINTTDAVKSYFRRGRKSKWCMGLMELRDWGVPEWYLHKIYIRVLGKVQHVEPVFVLGFIPMSSLEQMQESSPGPESDSSPDSISPRSSQQSARPTQGSTAAANPSSPKFRRRKARSDDPAIHGIPKRRRF